MLSGLNHSSLKESFQHSEVVTGKMENSVFANRFSPCDDVDWLAPGEKGSKKNCWTGLTLPQVCLQQMSGLKEWYER